MLTLNDDLLNAVVAQAKRRAAGSPRWLTAIDRAARELDTNPYIEPLDDHTLLIGSPSGETYTSNGACSCRAYQCELPCWHRACARLYQRYLEDEARHTAAVEMDELFA